MSAATISPLPSPGRPHGAQSVAQEVPVAAGDGGGAVQVFARAAFDVVVLGEYEEEAGVRRRSRPD
jgi:hypothetical protein